MLFQVDQLLLFQERQVAAHTHMLFVFMLRASDTFSFRICDYRMTCDCMLGSTSASSHLNFCMPCLCAESLEALANNEILQQFENDPQPFERQQPTCMCKLLFLLKELHAANSSVFGRYRLNDSRCVSI